MFEQEKYPSIFANQIGTHYQISMQQIFGNPYLYDETIYLLQTVYLIIKSVLKLVI